MNYLAQWLDLKRLNEHIFPPGPSSPFSDPAKQNLGFIISRLTTYLFPFAGLLLFAYLIWGGFSYLTSGGDPKAMEQAKGKVTNAIIGFLIIFIAYWLVQIFEYMFGLKTGTFGP